VSPNRVILDVAKGLFTLAKIGAKTHATVTVKVLTLATLGDATQLRIGLFTLYHPKVTKVSIVTVADVCVEMEKLIDIQEK
jgi:hypothetical protein